MDEIDRITIENIKFWGRRHKLTEEKIDLMVELYNHLPLVNVASVKEVEEAIKKCENTNK